MTRAPFEHTELAKATFKFPAIDNHAHPLLKEGHRSRFPFDGLLSEAQGPAIKDSIETLACFRATKQLSKLFGCDEDWETIRAARDKLEYNELCQKCFFPTGIQCLLLDDGLDGDKIVEEISWHDGFTKDPSRRIVRVEVVAQSIFRNLVSGVELDSRSLPGVCASFIEQFDSHLDSAGKDPFVVGFKSVACYRSGLDISPIPLLETEKVQIISRSLEDSLPDDKLSGKIRFSSKPLIDYLVRQTMKAAANCKKPVQFHTGLGDSDLSLSRATPSLLQPLIEANPDTPVVLLHASYPFTREAGYLTSVFANVYLDFGEIFPFVSAGGQRKVLEMVLELCPTTKIMWSTDGHWWPETYYLGTIQAREVLYDVLSDYIKRGDLSEGQAVTVVQRALFYNANKLYRLDLQPALGD